MCIYNLPGLIEPTGPCTAGYYCGVSSTEAAPAGEVYGDVCPTGSYCPTQTDVPVMCPVGTYQPGTGVDELTDCLPCTPGKFCQTIDQDAVTGSRTACINMYVMIESFYIHCAKCNYAYTFSSPYVVTVAIK